MRARLAAVFCRWSLLAAIISLATLPAANAQESGAATKAETTIREFYAWYVKAVIANRDPFKQDGAKMKQYVSARFIRQIQKLHDDEELSFDQFLHAQDVDDAWPKNIKVSNAQVKGDVATANVELKGSEMTQKLSVTARQEGGAWKIDKVDAK